MNQAIFALGMEIEVGFFISRTQVFPNYQTIN
jgi:hypothetical protein